MNEGSLAVSLRGTRTYRRALKSVAEDRGVDVADLVREALDAYVGDEIRPYLSFFASSNKSGDVETLVAETNDNR